jgi:hypothetical protein
MAAIAAMEEAMRDMRAKLRHMPPHVQDDIDTFARSFRNQLAAGAAAHIAFMLVAGEVSIEAKKQGRIPF